MVPQGLFSGQAAISAQGAQGNRCCYPTSSVGCLPPIGSLLLDPFASLQAPNSAGRPPAALPTKLCAVCRPVFPSSCSSSLRSRGTARGARSPVTSSAARASSPKRWAHIHCHAVRSTSAAARRPRTSGHDDSNGQCKHAHLPRLPKAVAAVHPPSHTLAKRNMPEFLWIAQAAWQERILVESWVCGPKLCWHV